MFPSIEIDNLTIQFDGKSVLSGFSLQLESGQKATLTGRSG
jgi:ABC-type transport system involved in cytochrome bd biosynthesis fused ATPase/permease subunit